MPKTYSTYEAKARLSELLNRVRKGDVVTITHRGQPVAELRPISQERASLSSRLETLRRNGIISQIDASDRPPLEPLARKRGALKRFLTSRE